MPNKSSAKKELRKAAKRTAANTKVKVAFRQALKVTKKAIIAKDASISEKIRDVQKKLDKAAKKGVIKKNTAARRLSRLTKLAKKSA